MSMLTLTDDNFYETMADHEGPLLVDFWARWCGPCRMMEPVLESLDLDVAVAKVDIDTNPALASAMRIKSVPTIILFIEGKPVYRMIGAKSKQSILDEIKDYL